jgi:hypothetical protein
MATPTCSAMAALPGPYRPQALTWPDDIFGKRTAASALIGS